MAHRCGTPEPSSTTSAEPPAWPGWVTNPVQIIVRSNFGGSATATLKT
jgi:hypothetical protein